MSNSGNQLYNLLSSSRTKLYDKVGRIEVISESIAEEQVTLHRQIGQVGELAR